MGPRGERPSDLEGGQMVVSLAFDGMAARNETRYAGGAQALRTGHHRATGATLAFPRTPQADGLTSLEEVGTAQRFAAGAIIAHEGDDVVDCFRVVSGAVRLSKLTIDGRRQVL